MPRIASAAAAHVGGCISEHRLKVAMTQDQLAAATDIDSSNIRAYEAGRAMPGIHSLLRIATALGAKPSELLDGLELDMFPAPRRGDHQRAS